MTYAVLSDIHGNLEALQAVEAALDVLPVRIDAHLLLGDLVGYNADPAACLARGLQIASCCIRGNHDKVVAGIASDRDFNDVAQAAARRHRQMLAPADLERLRTLQQGPVQAAPGIVLCHGSPQDEDLYLVDGYDARESFQTLSDRYPDAEYMFFRTYSCARGSTAGAAQTAGARHQDAGSRPCAAARRLTDTG